MRAGFATWDITPILGSESPGGLVKAFRRSVHDPLLVRAAVFGSAGERVALVGVDALSVKASMVAAARAQTERLCGLAPERILVAASHTHEGGPCVGPGADPVATAPDAAYVDRVGAAIASAISLANERRRDAWLAVGRGRESGVSFNRRFRMRQGFEMTHPGKGNPDIVEPAGPVDPEVGVLSAWDMATGGLLGCVVNFACHATTLGGPGYSADWIYYLDRTVRAVMGQETTVVFLNGAMGDVTQVNNLSREGRESGERSARLVGQSVGAEALKVLARARQPRAAEVDWRLAVLSERLTAGVRQPSAARLAAAQRLLEAGPAEEWGVERWYAREVLLLAERNLSEPTVGFEVQFLQVGPVGVVGNPAEYFCHLGLEIKASSPFPYTFVATLANGCIGYVPTARAMGSAGGGYESRLCRHSWLASGTGEEIRDASVALLRRGWAANPAPTPTWDPLPVGEPWDAGRHPSGE